MFDIGFSELLVIAVLGLLVLGPERLPKAARTVGLIVGRIRRTLNSIQDELELQIRAEELKEKMKDPYSTFMDEGHKPGEAKGQTDTTATEGADQTEAEKPAEAAAAEPAQMKPARQKPADSSSAGTTATEATSDTDRTDRPS